MLAARARHAAQLLQPRHQAVALALELAEVGQARPAATRLRGLLRRRQERKAVGNHPRELTLEPRDLALQRHTRRALKLDIAGRRASLQ